jgi:hypothetical protein
VASNLLTRCVTLDCLIPGVIMQPDTPFGPPRAGPPPPGDTDRPVVGQPSTGRTGITIGFLVIVLLALLFFFYWRSTGVHDATGHRPPPPRAER